MDNATRKEWNSYDRPRQCSRAFFSELSLVVRPLHHLLFIDTSQTLIGSHLKLQAAWMPYVDFLRLHLRHSDLRIQTVILHHAPIAQGFGEISCRRALLKGAGCEDILRGTSKKGSLSRLTELLHCLPIIAHQTEWGGGGVKSTISKGK